MKLLLPRLDPEYAYISKSLFLPKRHIEEGPVRSALLFGVDEEGDGRDLVRNHPDHLEVPRAFLSLEQMQELELQVIDLRPRAYPPVSIRPKTGFSFRPHQVPAWNAIKDSKDGVLVMSCGKGKTLMGWMRAAQTGGPILFVSWQKPHLAAALSELERFFTGTGKVGWIAGGKMEYDCPVVLCTIQTLAKRVETGTLPPDFASRFSAVIFDECHHLSAAWFGLGVDSTMGLRIGLTATKNRVDRLEGIFFSHIGPVLYEDLTQDLAPTFYVVDTHIAPTAEDEEEWKDVLGQRCFPKIRSWLGRNEARNEVIRQVLDEALIGGRKPYCLTHSVEQAELLHEDYPDSGLITGKVTSHKTRLSELQKTPAIATMGVGAESLNREDLDTLLLMTPFAARDYASPAFQQSVGRIQRLCPGKTSSEVFLFMDSAIEECKGMTLSLIREAQRQGFEVKGWTVNTGRRRPTGW